MRLVTYRVGARHGYGVVVPDGDDDAIVELGDRIPGAPTLRNLLDGRLDDVRPFLDEPPVLHLDDVELLPPIPDPARILCIGLNYAAHREETGRTPTDHPTVFVRFASSLVGHRRPIVRPAASDRLDWEGELAVVIGRGGRHIPEQQALEHVAGYSCFNDGSVRDFQSHTTQFTPGKNFDASGAFGPWLVTADEVPDPTA
ncbi:MAG: fumarylacetoacetate hydrolase family protein, partial [Acidimicrobiales bacterium]|nr:fumarylacetoacetate hydrolase family protein [Acidimicrobiales bacterium]